MSHPGPIWSDFAVELFRRHVRRRSHDLPLRVRCEIDSSRRASPKSEIIGSPAWSIIMLTGFRSRWMIFCRCASTIARAIFRTSSTASVDGSGFPGPTRLLNGSPSISAMLRKGTPSIWPMS